MSKQIFKNPPPINLLKELLENIAIKEGGVYRLNKYCFKKAILDNKIEPFINNIVEYYHKSKKKYVIKKKQTLTSLVTIIRQICKFYDIKISSKIKYHNSIYETIYYIHME
jgi:hypothetical protein